MYSMRNSQRITLALIAVVSFISIGLAGCAQSSDNPAGSNGLTGKKDCSSPLGKYEGITYPPAPNTPRIQYTALYMNNSNCSVGNEVVMTVSYPAYVAAGNGRIYASERNGVKAFDTNSGTMSAFSNVANATGLAVASNGDVYIGDSDNRGIAIYNSSNASVGTIGAGDFQNIQGIALDEANGLVYAVDIDAGTVRAYNTNGGAPSHVISGLYLPTGVAVNSQGNVYVVNQGTQKVQIYDASGASIGAFGYAGTVLGSFSRPKGVAVDSDDNVYVTDSGNGVFQIFNSSNQLLMAVPSIGGVDVLGLPSGIAVDGNDTVYVADYSNSAIKAFQYLGND